MGERGTSPDGVSGPKPSCSKVPLQSHRPDQERAALTQLVVPAMGGIACSRKPGIERRPDRWPSSGTVDSEVASHHENPGRMTKGTSHGFAAAARSKSQVPRRSFVGTGVEGLAFAGGRQITAVDQVDHVLSAAAKQQSGLAGRQRQIIVVGFLSFREARLRRGGHPVISLTERRATTPSQTFSNSVSRCAASAALLPLLRFAHRLPDLVLRPRCLLRELHPRPVPNPRACGLVVDLAQQLTCLQVSEQVARLVDVEIEESSERLIRDVAVFVDVLDDLLVDSVSPTAVIRSKTACASEAERWIRGARLSADNVFLPRSAESPSRTSRSPP